MATNTSQQNYMSPFSLIIRDVVYLAFSVVRIAVLSSSVYAKLQLFFSLSEAFKDFSVFFNVVLRHQTS